MAQLCILVSHHNQQCRKLLGVANAKLGVVKENMEIVQLEQIYEESMDGLNSAVDKADLVLLLSCEHCPFVDFISINV